jgi:hypothetical protein
VLRLVSILRIGVQVSYFRNESTKPLQKMFPKIVLVNNKSSKCKLMSKSRYMCMYVLLLTGKIDIFLLYIPVNFQPGQILKNLGTVYRLKYKLPCSTVFVGNVKIYECGSHPWFWWRLSSTSLLFLPYEKEVIFLWKCLVRKK